MHVIIAREQLLPFTNKVANVVGNRASIPIVENVLLEASGNELVATGTDLTVRIKLFLPAKVNKPGKMVVHAKRLSQLMRALTAPQVEFVAQNEGTLQVNASRSSFQLNGACIEEFPDFPDISSATRFDLKGSVIKEMIERSTYATSMSDQQFILSAVFLEVRDGSLRLVTTDGKRLAKTETAISIDKSTICSCLVPLKGIEEAVSLIENEEQVSLHIMEKRVGIQSKKGILLTDLLSGDFPDYAQLIPQNYTKTIALHREELMTLLRQLSLFTNEKCQSIRFSFREGELGLQINSLLGSGQVSMPVNYQQEDFDIALNPAHCLDVLRRSSDEIVQCQIIDAYHPIVFTDSSQAIASLMSMRLRVDTEQESSKTMTTAV